MPTRTCLESLSSGRCSRKAVRGSSLCIFHDSEVWKRRPKLLREEIRKQIKRGNFNFEKCHIPEIDFCNLVKDGGFQQAVNFIGAQFHGDAVFSDAKFFEKADFEHSKFFGDAIFRSAEFSKPAMFDSAQFFEDAKFSFTNFFRIAKFSRVKFFKTVSFIGAKFSSIASFLDTDFYDASFSEAEFSANVLFKRAKFGNFAGFDRAKFIGSAVFTGARFSETHFSGAEFCHSAVFMGVTFSGNTFFWYIDIGNVAFDFSASTFQQGVYVDEILWAQKNYRLRALENESLSRAIDSYHALKRTFSAMGEHRVAGELFYHEMACRRKLLSKAIQKVDYSSKRAFLKDLGDWLWM